MRDVKITIWVMVAVEMFLTVVNTASAVSHQLIDEYYLDVGNHWEYQVHITEDPDAGTVDWWGTEVEEVAGNEIIEGYDTAIIETTLDISGWGVSWSTHNCSLTQDYLLEIRYEDEEMIRIVRNNNPFECAPVWVNESDNNRHFGHGEHYGILKDPYYTWDGYQDSYITFLRTESVTVPAGTFDCVVVFIRTEFHEFAGLWGYDENTIWAYPEVGVVKTDEYVWMWDPIEEQEYTGRGTTELTSVSLVNHDPELGNGSVSPAYGYTDMDFYWYVDYYDTDGDAPAGKDIYIDGIAYTMSLYSGSASDGTYQYGPKKLQGGSHNYYFYFTDGKGGSDRFPKSGSNPGPTVISPKYMGDLNGDGFLNFTDLPFLASNWMRNDCNMSNEFCNQADIDLSGDVDYLDFAAFCDNWLNYLNLVGHWTMDDNADDTKVVDSSDNSNDGTAQQNTSVLSTTGKIGSALTFNGSGDYINCGNDSSLDLTDNFTIAAWIKPTSFSRLGGIVGKYHTYPANSYWLRLGSDYPYNKVSFGGKTILHSSSTLNANQWYFIVAISDSGIGKIYINGNLDASSAVSISSSSDPVCIGADYLGDPRYFDGIIDNVMILNRALSTGEIQQLYQDGSN